MRRWVAALGALALVVLATGCTTVIRSSVASDGTGPSSGAWLENAQAISDDGRYVVFDATQLGPDDTNGKFDVFRHDNVTGATVRVSVTDAEGQIPADSVYQAMSGNGDHVAFTTDAALEAADTNGATDVYVRTISTGRTERVSIAPDGSQLVPNASWSIGNVKISDNGNRLLMWTSNTVTGGLFMRDRAAHATTPLAGLIKNALLSGDGNTLVLGEVCLNGDTCRHRALVGAPVLGAPAVDIDTECGFNAFDVSADGRYVLGQRFALPPAWTCPTPNGLVRWDRTTGAFLAVPLFQGLSPELTTSMSNDGRFVATVEGTLRVRVADLVTGIVQNPDASPGGQAGPGPAFGAGISGNGRTVVLQTNSRLTPDDGDDSDAVYTTFTVRPSVSSVAPASLSRGTSHATVTVTGTEFLTGLEAVVAGTGVTVHSVTVDSPTKARLDVSVAADAAPSARNLVVSNTAVIGQSDALCVGCLTIS